MSDGYIMNTRTPDFSLWDKMSKKKLPVSMELELTARCNNNCRHCYINLPPGDRQVQGDELTMDEIDKISDQAVAMGTMWCLITGGEPLLRKDFADIYMMLKRKGLLVSVFTNACLINEEHVELFKKYPPRDIEVSVYGVTKETYEKVTQKPGSFKAFMRGLGMLSNAGIKVRFKAMAIRSNVHELPAIARFCRERTCDYFRFDPMLHKRFDGNPVRNEEIRAERLSPEEVAAIEQADDERATMLDDSCDRLMMPDNTGLNNKYLFYCGTGDGSFTVGYNGIFRLCSSLWHPDCIYDLRKGPLKDAYCNLVPRVRAMCSDSPEYLEKCHVCKISNFCLWCPAHAYLESGKIDAWCDYFCQVAHARVAAIQQKR